MKIDLTKTGLEAIFKPYQVTLVNLLFKEREHVTSRRAHEYLDKPEYYREETGRPVSRASTINFLNALVDQGYLEYTEETGKGGIKRRYHAMMSLDDLWAKIFSVSTRIYELGVEH